VRLKNSFKLYFVSSYFVVASALCSVFRRKAYYLENPEEFLFVTSNILMLISYSNVWKKIELLLSIYE